MRPIVRRSGEMAPVATRRAGVAERRLLGPSQSRHQNVVLIDAAPGAAVELHPVENSESFFVLDGEIEVFGDGWHERLGAGDLCHFPPATAHGVRVGREPARFLVVFAPARGG